MGRRRVGGVEGTSGRSVGLERVPHSVEVARGLGTPEPHPGLSWPRWGGMVGRRTRTLALKVTEGELCRLDALACVLGRTDGRTGVVRMALDGLQLSLTGDQARAVEGLLRGDPGELAERIRQHNWRLRREMGVLRGGGTVSVSGGVAGGPPGDPVDPRDWLSRRNLIDLLGEGVWPVRWLIANGRLAGRYFPGAMQPRFSLSVARAELARARREGHLEKWSAERRTKLGGATQAELRRAQRAAQRRLATDAGAGVGTGAPGTYLGEDGEPLGGLQPLDEPFRSAIDATPGSVAGARLAEPARLPRVDPPSRPAEDDDEDEAPGADEEDPSAGSGEPAAGSGEGADVAGPGPGSA